MKHNEACEKAREKFRKDCFTFSLLYPYHCGRCGGTGVEDKHDCGCVVRGVCPLCANRIYSTSGIKYCTSCGWTSSVDVDIPQAPVCLCNGDA